MLEFLSNPYYSIPLSSFSTWVILRYRNHISERATQLSDHLKDVEKLSEAALAAIGSSNGEAVSSEKMHKVILCHKVAAKSYPDIKSICYDRGGDYQEFMLKLFHLATADNQDFLDVYGVDLDESMKQRIEDLLIVSSDLIYFLRSIRRDSFSFSYLIKDTTHSVKKCWENFYDACLKP